MITLKFTLKSGREIELTDAELREVMDAYRGLSEQVVNIPFVQPVPYAPIDTWIKTTTNTKCGNMGCNKYVGHPGACDPIVSFRGTLGGVDIYSN